MIVGAGAVGTAVAHLLAQRGEPVRIVSRRGGGPTHPQVERVAADGTDPDRITTLAKDAVALYNCANPPYHKWLTDWPPLAAALLTAAERTGAVLATASNLYGYGPVSGPITSQTPLDATHPKLRVRADMWRDAFSAHQAGRLRATEVRASDYLEANSLLAYSIAKPVLAGKRAYVPAPLDVPHSWTAIADVARTLVTVANNQRGWGQAWLVPSHPPMTVRQLTERFAAATGAPPPKLTALPYPVLWFTGVFVPVVRELRTVRYQFTRPFVLDASATTTEFGIHPSPLDEALRHTAEPLRA